MRALIRKWLGIQPCSCTTVKYFSDDTVEMSGAAIERALRARTRETGRSL